MTEKPPELEHKKLKVGQIVRVKKGSGFAEFVEDGWTIKLLTNSKKAVLEKTDRATGTPIKRTVSQEELLGWQDLPLTPETEEINLSPLAETPAPKDEDLETGKTNVLDTQRGEEKDFDGSPKLSSILPEEITAIPETLGREAEAETTQGVPEEVEDFIAENNLAPLLPAEFEILDNAQKLKVVQDLKRRIVDIVKADAQTQYSKDFEQKGGIAKIRASISKELKIKNFEKKVFAELINTEEGKKLIKEDLEILTKKAGRQDVYVGDNGLFIAYLNTSETGRTEKEIIAIYNFNEKANKFTSMPYEWGQEKSGKHKKEYEIAQINYYKAREEVLASREKPEEKGQAVLEMLEIDNAIQMEQLLNTHPEFEKALGDFERSAGGKEMVKSAGNFLQTITGGKNLANKLFFAGGFGARIGVRALSAASSMSLVGVLGTTTVGGVIGWYKGKMRGKETLQERQKQARRGLEDKSTEAKNTVNAENLNERMTTMIQAFEKASTPGEKAKRLDQIKRRIEYTQNKIEDGLVNFGDTKTALSNQYNLVNNINNALVISASSEEKTKKEIDDRLDRFLAYRANKIGKAQDKFIREQARKGAIYGAGFATIGYGARMLGEHFGWWGGHGAENVPPRGTVADHDLEEKIAHNPAPAHDVTNIPEAKLVPEHTPDTPSSDAIVHKGEGIEHAFRRQIEHDPKLAQALGFKGDIKEVEELHKFSGGAAHKLAIEKGYAEIGGEHEVRITEAGKVAYEVKLSGDKVLVNERGIDGKILHIDNDGKYPFGENPNNPYDKEFNAPAHETVSEPQHLGAGAKIESAPTAEELKAHIEMNMANHSQNIPNVSNEQNIGEGAETAQNAPFHVENNPFHLPEETLKQVDKISTENIQHIFPNDTDEVWGAFKNSPADEVMHTTEFEDPQHQNFVLYLRKLHDITDLNPISKTIIRGAETDEEYIKRTLQFIAANKPDKLTEIKL